MKKTTCALVLISVLSLTMDGEGTPIFTSAGYSGSPFGSWTIAGPSSPKDDFETATRFSFSGADAVLESATVFAAHERGLNSYTFKLLADNGGEPGLLLDSVSGVVLPTTPGLVTGSFLAGITLTAGVPYWLLISPGSDSEGSWFDTEAAPVTTIATHPASGGTWNVYSSPPRAIMFQIEGSRVVPDGGTTALLFGLALFGLAATRRHLS